MDSDSNLFCPYPWISYCTKTDGASAPCDLSEYSNKGINPYPSPTVYKNEIQNTEFLKKLRLDLIRGVKNANCEKCWKAEANGMTSLRQHTKNFFPHDIEWGRKNTGPDGSINGVIEFFDIRPGHKCNLKCRMCTIVQSSAWLSDHEFLTGGKFDGEGRNFLWGEDSQAWENIFLNIENSLRSVEKVHVLFVGGEPLIEKNHLEFLGRCVNSGLASRIDLRYTSNITLLPDTVLKLWESFRSLNLAASIDAIGELNDYIRYPSSWKHLERNLQKLLDADHVYVWLQPCASIYNIFDLPKVYLWATEKTQVYKGEQVSLSVHSHIVHEPQDLSICNLSDEAVTALKTEFSQYANLPGADFLTGALSFAQQKVESFSMKPFWDFTTKLDARRRQNFSEISPEWALILRGSAS